jgi:hypothetical protein
LRPRLLLREGVTAAERVVAAVPRTGRVRTGQGLDGAAPRHLTAAETLPDEFDAPYPSSEGVGHAGRLDARQPGVAREPGIPGEAGVARQARVAWEARISRERVLREARISREPGIRDPWIGKPGVAGETGIHRHPRIGKTGVAGDARVPGKARRPDPTRISRELPTGLHRTGDEDRSHRDDHSGDESQPASVEGEERHARPPFC